MKIRFVNPVCLLSSLIITDAILSCNNTFQCNNAIINDDIRVDCPGYYSCYNSNISSNSIKCSGNHACSDAVINTRDYIFCNGKSGCNSATLLISNGISCNGEYGCSDVGRLTALMQVGCNGYMSCLNANINGTGIVIASGNRALDGATIDSTGAVVWFSGENGMIIDIGGDSATSNTNIICRANDTCILICRSNGCAGVTYNCDELSTCIVKPFRCMINIKGKIIDQVLGIKCPSQINYGTTNEIEMNDDKMDYIVSTMMEFRKFKHDNDMNTAFQSLFNQESIPTKEFIHPKTPILPRNQNSNEFQFIFGIFIGLFLAFIGFGIYNKIFSHKEYISL